MERLVSYTKICCSILFSIGILLSFSASRAEAAGAMKFDYENSGIEQEKQYRLSEGTWKISSQKDYEYYPDGTIKTVHVENEDVSYEGHYDPYGHLMDPAWTFYSGYTEGVIFDSNPERTYDDEGRLTHFEAMRIDFDNAVPYLIEVDYEYDSQNRAARVSYSSQSLSDDLILPESTEGMSAGYIFSYAQEGNYSITHETRYGTGIIYRTAFTYDTGGRLTRYDSSSETVNHSDDKYYTDSESYLYYYDKDGYLIRESIYRNRELSPSVQYEYRYWKKNDQTVTCDVYESHGGREAEHFSTNIYTFDEEGKLIGEDIGTAINYCYEYSLGNMKMSSLTNRIVDIKYYGSYLSHPRYYYLMLMSDGTVVGSNLDAFFPQKSIEEIYSWSDIVQVIACDAGIIGLRRDGSVVAVTNPHDSHLSDDYEYESVLQYTSEWQNVKKLVEAGGGFFALTYDGRVLVPGILKAPMFAEYKDWDYSQWSELEDLISYGSPQSHGLYGLKRDGSVICTEPLEGSLHHLIEPYYHFESKVDDIVAIDSSQFLFTALKRNGTVLAAGSEASNKAFRDEVRKLKNVTQVVAMNASVAVRLSNGTVKVINCYGEEYADQSMTTETPRWQNIRKIYTNRYLLFGLDGNGRVHVAGNSEAASYIDQGKIENWRDIVDLKVYGDFYGGSYVLAWQSDGTLLTEGLGELELPN